MQEQLTTETVQTRMNQLFQNPQITEVKKNAIDFTAGHFIPGMSGVFVERVTYTTFILDNLKYLLLSTGQTFNFNTNN